MMLNINEKRILEILDKNHLMTRSELSSTMEKENLNGTETIINRLKDRGLVDNVQNLGNCIVITKSGMRALKSKV